MIPKDAAKRGWPITDYAPARIFPNCAFHGRRGPLRKGLPMTEQFGKMKVGKNWHVMARKRLGSPIGAAWVSLGGCPNERIAEAVVLALIASGSAL